VTRRFPRRALAVLTAAAVALAGCAPTGYGRPIAKQSGASAAPGAVQPVEWGRCDEPVRASANATIDCATLPVPQDWANPGDGKTFDLALVRVRATRQSDRIGSLVVNPGGPGGSGWDLAVSMARWMPADVMERFDIVGFDPRGVGRSNGVDCFTDADLDLYFGLDQDTPSQADFDAYATLSRRMAQGCADKHRDTLHLFSTEQSARDLDAIRAAVGDEKLTYLGYSYGTLLGAVYAHLFPKNIRALVLDGAVNPSLDSIGHAEGQAKGFELAFSNFVAWCRTASQCAISPDARAVFNSALAKSKTAPVTDSRGRRATAGWVLLAVISALYSKERWADLASAFAAIERGDASGVFELADAYAERDSSGRYANLFDSFLTISCTDEDDGPSVERWRQIQQDWRAKYPTFGASLALNLICAQWPGKRDGYPVGKAEGAPPILVVGTRGDPATPYEHAPALAQILGTGVVLTWEGEGHTAYPATRCITGAVNEYLISVRTPSGSEANCPA